VIDAAPAVEPPSVDDTLVSVIVPAYQAERHILGAVLSALRQSHRALEVWVVDDGSTDGTAERLAAIADPRLHVLRQANAGTGAARNAALERATGSYIAFLDSDDRWFPEKIATELAILRSAPEPVGIAYSAHYAVDDRGALVHLGPLRRYTGRAFDALLDGDDFLMPSLCLFDRRIFDEIGAFDARHYHEDYEFMLRATRRFPIYPTGSRLAVYRHSTAGKCRAILHDYERARNADFALARENGPGFSPDETRRLAENAARSLYLRFLMYGFSAHARRLRSEVDVSGLRGAKGRLGYLFAKTGINLVAPARQAVQAFYRSTRQAAWKRRLAAAHLELRYE